MLIYLRDFSNQEEVNSNVKYELLQQVISHKTAPLYLSPPQFLCKKAISINRLHSFNVGSVVVTHDTT